MADQSRQQIQLSGDALLALTQARPDEALAVAQAMLASRDDPEIRSFALQATGLVHRDRGATSIALSALRQSVRCAERAGLPDRVADATASLGIALALAGRSRAGLEQIDIALAHARGRLRGRIMLRRATILLESGQIESSLEGFRSAIRILRRSDDRLWEARAIQNRGLAELAYGSVGRATASFRSAQRIFSALGQDYEAALATHNLGLAALGSGDLPSALERLSRAQAAYAAVNARVPELTIDRSEALLIAGLIDEARALIDRETAWFSAHGGNRAALAELLLAGARAELAGGAANEAEQRATRARRMFIRQDRRRLTDRAEQVLIRARAASGSPTRPLARRAMGLASRLEAADSRHAADTHLLAGSLAFSSGLVREGAYHLERAARHRLRGPALSRAAGWLARARLSAAHNRRVPMLTACRRGLAAVEEHLATLGATELRVHATRHGADLSGLAIRDAYARRDARSLVHWTERWRGIALDLPATERHEPPELARRLASLREITRRCEAAVTSDLPVPAHLAHERARLEREVRDSARASRRGTVLSPQSDTSPQTTLEEIERGVSVVVLVHLDGNLVSVTFDGSATTMHAVGPIANAIREAEFARFTLRRAASRRSAASVPLGVVGERLQDALFGGGDRIPNRDRIVIVPPAALHNVPWGLLPALTERAVSVAPSLGTWHRSRRMPSPRRGSVVLIAGPGLESGGAEVRRLAENRPGAVSLTGGEATTEAALRALSGARVAHLAAHGTFRPESPMFSSLRLEDGPMTMLDLERIKRMPHRVVMSACDSGVCAPAGADEMLGLAAALLGGGTAGLIAGVTPVNDEASVEVALAVHAALDTGADAGQALAEARNRCGDDELLRATAGSMVALGA